MAIAPSILALLLALPNGILSPIAHSLQTEVLVMNQVTGSFSVKMAPTGHAPEPTIQSLVLTKTYEGPLTATSTGEMLASGDPGSGNAGYVAIERVTGTLEGKTGSFALMHFGTMTRGAPPQLTVNVIPGSGTGGLTGLYGSMTITVAPGGAHAYTLSFAFAGV